MLDLTLRLHLLHISILMARNPPALFERLGGLDWYGGLLDRWTQPLTQAGHRRVLELGCGPGLLVQRLRRRGLHATGLDRSLAMVRRAHMLAPNAEFVQGDGANLPFADAVFDDVIAASLVNVVPAPEALIGDAVRVLAAGGRLWLLVPTPRMTADHARSLARRRRLRGFAAAALIAWARFAPKMDREKLEGMLTAAGLEIDRRTDRLDAMVFEITGRKPG